ncbi:MAG: tRNA uridine-5-carboxymethylaminomethyl(34) synthesis GTPase MnmE [bacterium]
MISTHEDTIAGIATAPGEAGIAIIRISGNLALPVAAKIFRAKNDQPLQQIKNRVLTFGWIENSGSSLDEVLLCIMRKPHSFTAEDVVEIHCHGGIYLTQVILKLILDAGARLAGPGEFTQRAFLNGRIDLTQAEATNDIIRARSLLELDLVVNQLKGKLFQRIVAIKEQVAWVLALVNADIDFPEEEQVFAHQETVTEKLKTAKTALVKLIGSAETGMKIREGYKIVLTGKPNVGKSSILNGLLEESRAIVNQLPGTTRDTIEESCTIGGIPASLIDTAGIHATTDAVEQEGISRALAAVEKADLVLWVIDMVNPSFENRLGERLDLSDIPMIIVLNKSDLFGPEPFAVPGELSTCRCITISALLEKDIERLRTEIYQQISGQNHRLTEETMLTNLRQQKAAETALVFLNNATDSLEQGFGPELLAVDLAQTLQALGEIVGETTPDDMLNQIFSQFCIGK